LFELLHEGGDIAHAAGEGLADMWADGAGALEVGPGQRREEALFTVEGFGPLEEDGVWNVRGSGYSDEQVEVIGHHAIGEDLHPTELSEREEQIDQTLLG
jgi:hypothetical protein